MGKMEILEKVVRFLQERDDFLIVSHVFPDGDAIGSVLTMNWILKKIGKKYTTVIDSPPNEKFNFLPDWKEIKRPDQLAGQKFSSVIILDCSGLGRIGKCIELISFGAKILNIDHHTTNELFGNINYVDDEASATAEMLYKLIKHMSISATEDVGACVFTAIYTDTGGFKFSNATPETIRIFAELKERGVSTSELAEKIEVLSIEQTMLLKFALNSLGMSENSKICWMILTQQDFETCNANVSDAQAVINYTLVQGVEIGIFLIETQDKKVKVSFRSRGFNISNIAKRFNGGGHPKAAGCILDMSLDEAINVVVAAAEEALGSVR